jgi:hypothetical protein
VDAQANATLAACRAAASVATMPSLSTPQMLSQLDPFGFGVLHAAQQVAAAAAAASGAVQQSSTSSYAPPLSPSLPFGARVPSSLFASHLRAGGGGSGVGTQPQAHQPHMATPTSLLPSQQQQQQQSLIDDVTATAAWAIAAGLPLGADGFALRPAAPFPSVPSSPVGGSHNSHVNGWTSHNNSSNNNGMSHQSVSAAAAAVHPSMTAFIPFGTSSMYPPLSPQNYMSMAAAVAAAAAAAAVATPSGSSATANTNASQLLNLPSSYLQSLAPVSPPIRIGGSGMYSSLFPAATASTQQQQQQAVVAAMAHALAAASSGLANAPPLSPTIGSNTSGSLHTSNMLGSGAPLSPLMPGTPPIVSPLRTNRSIAFNGISGQNGNNPNSLSLASNHINIGASSGGPGSTNSTTGLMISPPSPSLASSSPSINVRNLSSLQHHMNTTAMQQQVSSISMIGVDALSPTTASSPSTRKRRSMGDNVNFIGMGSTGSNNGMIDSSTSSLSLPATNPSLKRLRSNGSASGGADDHDTGGGAGVVTGNIAATTTISGRLTPSSLSRAISRSPDHTGATQLRRLAHVQATSSHQQPHIMPTAPSLLPFGVSSAAVGAVAPSLSSMVTMNNTDIHDNTSTSIINGSNTNTTNNNNNSNSNGVGSTSVNGVITTTTTATGSRHIVAPPSSLSMLGRRS